MNYKKKWHNFLSIFLVFMGKDLRTLIFLSVYTETIICSVQSQ